MPPTTPARRASSRASRSAIQASIAPLRTSRRRKARAHSAPDNGYSGDAATAGDDKSGPLEEMGIDGDLLAVVDIPPDGSDSDSEIEISEETKSAIPPDDPIFDTPVMKKLPFAETPGHLILCQPHAEMSIPTWGDDLVKKHPPIPGYRAAVESDEASFHRLMNSECKGSASGELIDLAVAALYTRYPKRRDFVVAVPTLTLSSWSHKVFTAEMAYRRALPYAPWSRQCVLIPVHGNNHWMLVALYPSVGVVEYFDCLGPRDEDALKWCGLAVSWARAIWECASSSGTACDVAAYGVSRPIVPLSDTWHYSIMKFNNVQDSDRDCSIWTIAQIEAVFRGYRVTGWERTSMQAYRTFLAHIIFFDFAVWPTPDGSDVAEGLQCSAGTVARINDK